METIKNLLYNCILFFLATTMYGQSEHYKKYGDVSVEDFKLEKDGENALCIFDVGKSHFIEYDNWYKIEFNRHRRTIILEESGTEEAVINIPIYRHEHNKEFVASFDGSAYTLENGIITKTEIDEESMYEETLNENWSILKIVIPNCQKGSIIEYSYDLISPFYFNLKDWEFQSNIPTLYSAYFVAMIPFYEYAVIINADLDLLDYENYRSKGLEREYGILKFHDNIHEYEMYDLPAFYDESFISSKNDYIYKIDFQLAKIVSSDGYRTEVISTWEKLVQDLLKDERFGYYIEKAEREAKLIFKKNPSLIQGSELEIANNIINHIKSNFTFNGLTTKYGDTKPKDLIKKGVGSSGELNLLTIALLRKANIEVKPILLSTRKNGKIKVNYPFLHFFNNVVPLIIVNEGSFMTDVSNTNITNQNLPIECINGVGLLVDKDAMNWVELYKPLNSLNKHIIGQNINLNKDFIEIQFLNQSTDYQAEKNRNNYGGNNIEKLKNEHFEKSFNQISDASFKNSDNTDLPFMKTIKGQTYLTKFENEIILNPFLKFPLQENPLKAKERNYPVDFIFPLENVFHSKINIEHDFEITYQPKDTVIENEIYHLQYKTEKIGKHIQVMAKYKFNKELYLSSEYANLKESFDEIIEILNQNIIIKIDK